MNRSLLDGSFGVVFGVLAGLACGGGLGLVVIAVADFGKEAAVLTAAAFASHGALVGAVIGTGRDIITTIREAFPNRNGPEADYREPPAG